MGWFIIFELAITVLNKTV